MSGDFYHMSQKAISAAKGQSAVAAAAYRHGAKMERDLTGDAADFRAKKDCVHAEIALPEGAPDWAVEAQSPQKVQLKRNDLTEQKE